MNADILRWLEYADADLDVASFLFENRYPQPLEIICFHCQQAAEKAIKAVYLWADVPGGIPRKHDLAFLLEQLTGRLSIEERYFDCAEALNPFGISARYPNEIHVDEVITREAIHSAREIILWARRIIG